jgi:Ser/Thr protein kinase RdoA (MazF antagonist)
MDNLSQATLERGLANCLNQAQAQAWSTLKSSWLSRVERVSLDDGKTVVLKMARKPLHREGELYRDVMPTLNVPVPRLLGEAELDDLFFWAFEDIHGVPLAEAPTQAGYESAARLLAQMQLNAAPVLHRFNLPILALADISSEIKEATASLLDDHWTGVEFSVKANVRDLNKNSRRLAAKIVNQPFTLIHGDYNGSNLVSAREAIYVLDWPCAHVAPYQGDLEDLLADARQHGLYTTAIFSAFCRTMADPLATRHLSTLLLAAAVVRHCYRLNWLRRVEEQLPDASFSQLAVKQAVLIDQAWAKLRA